MTSTLEEGNFVVLRVVFKAENSELILKNSWIKYPRTTVTSVAPNANILRDAERRSARLSFSVNHSFKPRSTSDEFITGKPDVVGSAIPIGPTIPVTPFTIYQQSSDVIELDMNIITCFSYEEYIVEFKSRKFR